MHKNLIYESFYLFYLFNLYLTLKYYNSLQKNIN